MKLDAVIRGGVPRLILDDVSEQKTKIGKAVASELEKATSHHGFEIVENLIVDIEPDERVKRAMNEINAGMLQDSPIRQPAEEFLTLRAFGAPPIVMALAAQHR